MNRSATISEFATAFAKAQGQMENASKSADNEFFKKPYADLASIVDAIKKPLSDNGICYVQTTDISREGEVIVETTLFHASGEWLSSMLAMKPVKFDPQGIGSCLTYARRYALQTIVGLAAEDDDGNAASGTGPKVTQTQGASRPPAATKATPQQRQAPPADGEPQHYCQIHNTPFKQVTRGTQKWYSHILPDGKYCNEAKATQAEAPAVPEPADPSSEIFPLVDIRETASEQVANAQVPTAEEHKEAAIRAGLLDDITRLLAVTGKSAETMKATALKDTGNDNWQTAHIDVLNGWKERLDKLPKVGGAA